MDSRISAWAVCLKIPQKCQKPISTLSFHKNVEIPNKKCFIFMASHVFVRMSILFESASHCVRMTLSLETKQNVPNLEMKDQNRFVSKV